MKRPGGARAASGSSSSRTAARYPRDHESRTARWRLREQSTGKLPRKGLEHSSECKSIEAVYSVRAAFGSASRWRVQRATSAQHSSAKRPSAHRAPPRGPSASIRKDREAFQTRPQSAKGPHGRKESATSGDVR